METPRKFIIVYFNFNLLLYHFTVNKYIIYVGVCIGYHMRGEVISVLSLEGRYRILSRVSAANEGQNMIS